MRTRDLKVGKFYQIEFMDSPDVSLQFIGPTLLLEKDEKEGQLHKFNTGFEAGWFASRHVLNEVKIGELFQFNY